MKKQAWMATLALAVAGGAFAAGDHKHDEYTPRHGGMVAPGKEADFELVAKPGTLRLYLSDHGKPMDLSKASAKVTLLAGAEKTEVELKSAGDKLEAKGSFKVAAGTKAVAVVTNSGKTLGTARFTLK
ncbi:hypothetical protein SAMN05444679_119111 [Variovorax sp. CF079]|uniref:hypothetical protein n=1 Tax=Variovorax sp. CF079 TaxID=1882774 RepID=UPI000888548D|nr:hypothetical protein [Variovorax sp. CF079]SDE24777.1 hypothetical protein SAMN05444679_119111 [Variovorax sp. CF079]